MVVSQFDKKNLQHCLEGHGTDRLSYRRSVEISESFLTLLRGIPNQYSARAVLVPLKNLIELLADQL